MAPPGTANPYHSGSDTDDSDFSDIKMIKRMSDDPDAERWIRLFQDNSLDAVRGRLLTRELRAQARETIRKMLPSMQIAAGGLENLAVVKSIDESLEKHGYQPERLGEIYALC